MLPYTTNESSRLGPSDPTNVWATSKDYSNSYTDYFR
eukprot:SAG11_NODE_35250_length_267_cov_1.160714_1_plen_36_part_01